MDIQKQPSSDAEDTKDCLAQPFKSANLQKKDKIIQVFMDTSSTQ